MNYYDLNAQEFFTDTVDADMSSHYEEFLKLLPENACILDCGCGSGRDAKYFKEFKGAKRRFTETVVGNDVIIDDYAHHPNEVKSTINAIRQKYPDKKIVAIFQPHTFTRTKEFASDLAKVFSKNILEFES